MLALLQSYRGFAALLVVALHASGAAQAYFGNDRVLNVLNSGWSGVQFFFVLSGFIIYHIHSGDIGTPARLRPYAAKRLIRIYPVYWLVTLPQVPVWLWTSMGEPYHKDIGALFKSLLLIPQDHLPHLGVAWTLTHEMLFYTLFGLLMLRRSLGVGVLALWFSVTAICLVSGVDLVFPWSFFFSPNNLLFALGMLAAKLSTRFDAQLQRTSIPFWVGNVAFIVALLIADEPSVPMICVFGLASFCIMTQAKNVALNAAMRGRLWLLLGDASYSIYLVHYPVISVMCKLLDYTPVSAMLAFPIVAVGAVAAGVILHLYFERPVLEYLRRRLARRPESQLVRVSSSVRSTNSVGE